MGISCAPDIFQDKISALVESLEFARVYIDELLVLSKDTFADPLERLDKVLNLIEKAGLKCNEEKCTLCATQVKYLGYLLIRDGICPLPAKVSAILAIKPPKNVRNIRRFLGIIQYYQDLWGERSHILAPLKNLVGECRVTKSKTKEANKFTWLPILKKAYECIKQLVSRAVTLAYPDFTIIFEVFT